MRQPALKYIWVIPAQRTGESSAPRRSLFQLVQDLPPRGRHHDLRAALRLCYTSVGGDEAEEYLPNQPQRAGESESLAATAAGKGAVEPCFLRDQLSRVLSFEFSVLSLSGRSITHNS